jgi:hypothetical protein
VAKIRTCACGNPKLPGRSLCRECKNAKLKERYATDEEYRKKVISAQKGQYDPEARKQLYHYYRRKAFEVLGGYTCKRCGFDDPRALQIDHVDDTGYVKRRSGEMGETLYRKVIETGGLGFQVLCANCNWIKKAEFEGRTLEYYWIEELGVFNPPVRATSKVDPEVTYQAFQTDEPASSIAKRLHISNSTLFRLWVEKFGPDTVRSRSKEVQSKAVKQWFRDKKSGVRH